MVTTNGNGASIKRYMGISIIHRKLDKRQRACLAADLADGLAYFQRTDSQAAMLMDVSVAYVEHARRLSPLRRGAILSGADQTRFTTLLFALRRLALPAPAPAGRDDVQTEHHS